MSKKSDSFIKKFWPGEVSMVKSFWIFNIIIDLSREPNNSWWIAFMDSNPQTDSKGSNYFKVFYELLKLLLVYVAVWSKSEFAPTFFS